MPCNSALFGGGLECIIYSASEGVPAGGEVFVARTDYFSCFGRLHFFAPDCPAPLSGKQAGITGDLLFMFETISTFAFNPHYNDATDFGPSL